MDEEKIETDVAVDDPQEALSELAKLTEHPQEDSFLPGDVRSDQLFVYDELLSPAVISRYLSHPRKGIIAHMPMHRLVFPKFFPPRNSGLASIVRSRVRDDSVWGITFDLAGQDLKRLDHYKGVPNRYHTRAVVVVDRGGRKSVAMTYVISAPDEEPSRPSKELLKLIVEGARTRNLPEDYVKMLWELETLD
ncbi:gamma-glutamylcyclotransferase [bacterium]|nr:gamma-glutamylcyclotransferase [bacterium]